MDLISFENVAYRYSDSPVLALDHVSLKIPAGSFFALLGPNGAGKTTLLRFLCGRFAKYNGTLSVDKSLRNDDGFLDARKYGVLLENPGTYPKLAIEEYLSYFAAFYGMGEDACKPGGKARERTEMFAKRLGIISLDQRMSDLSLGNRQKVQIIRALLPRPKLLILDEPVANLDPMSREIVWKLIGEWKEECKGTAIVCSHILAEMDQYATHYAIIDCGEILKTGIVSEVSDDVNFLVSVKKSIDSNAIKKALEDAGIKDVVVSARKGALSSIYRDAVRKNGARLL